MAGAVYSDPVSQGLQSASNTAETGMGLMNRKRLTDTAVQRTENDTARMEAAVQVAEREMQQFDDQMEAEKQARAANLEIDQAFAEERINQIRQGAAAYQNADQQAQVEEDLIKWEGIISKVFPGATKEKRAEVLDMLGRRAVAQGQAQRATDIFKQISEAGLTNPNIDQKRLENVALGVQEWLQSGGKEGMSPEDAGTQINSLFEADDALSIRIADSDAFFSDPTLGTDPAGASLRGALSNDIKSGRKTLADALLEYTASEFNPRAVEVAEIERRAAEEATLAAEQKAYHASPFFSEDWDLASPEGFAQYMDGFDRWREGNDPVAGRKVGAKVYEGGSSKWYGMSRDRRRAAGKAIVAGKPPRGVKFEDVPPELLSLYQEAAAAMEEGEGVQPTGAVAPPPAKDGGKVGARPATGEKGYLTGEGDEPKLLKVPKRKPKETLEAYVKRMQDGNVPEADIIEAIKAEDAKLKP